MHLPGHCLTQRTDNHPPVSRFASWTTAFSRLNHPMPAIVNLLRRFITVFFPSALLAILVLCGCSGSYLLPEARKGQLDLSASTEQLRTGSIPLKGEWEFYWQQLLTPADFSSSSTPAVSGYLTAPSVWNNAKFKNSTDQPGNTGYATLRLRLNPGNYHGEVLLQLPYAYSACRMWVDNRLLFEGGKVAGNVAEEVPVQEVQQALLKLDGKPIELTLQISNFHYRVGGMPSAPIIGSEAYLNRTTQTRQALLWLSTGSLAVMVLYHFCLYWLRRQEVAPLYFAGQVTAWIVSSITLDANGWELRTLLGGDIPVALLYRIDNIAMPFVTSFSYSFFRALFPLEFPGWLERCNWVGTATITLLGISLSSLLFTQIHQIYYIGNQIMVMYCIWRLLHACRNRRDGALFILSGFGAMGLAASNDMLNDTQLIHTVYLMDLGMFLYIMAQVLALASRFSNSFTTVAKLSEELTNKNISLEEEIAERSRLEQEVVSISEEERRRVSHDLHDGLCQQLTGARLRFSVLKRHNPELQTSQWEKFSALLETAVDEAYDLSRGLWPVEHGSDGTCPSLEELTRRLSESSGVAIQLHQRLTCTACRHGALLQLYRIAQEAINNAIKHADPAMIEVNLICEEQRLLTLTVRDNGIGRKKSGSSTPGGLGMRIMAYRARIIGATLTVSDAKGGGTLVTCSIPCDNAAVKE